MCSQSDSELNLRIHAFFVQVKSYEFILCGKVMNEEKVFTASTSKTHTYENAKDEELRLADSNLT